MFSVIYYSNTTLLIVTRNAVTGKIRNFNLSKNPRFDLEKD